MTHQAEASRKQGQGIRSLYQDSRTALVSGRRHAHPARKKIAEAPQALEANLEANLGDRMPPYQQKFGVIQPRPYTKLVRRETEQRLKPADEVKRRHPRFPRDVLNRERLLPHFAEQLSSPAETSESIVPQEHPFQFTAENSESKVQPAKTNAT
jgi:hypothetical protein